jgi:hypothetical protein
VTFQVKKPFPLTTGANQWHGPEYEPSQFIEENIVTQSGFWRALVILGFSLALCMPAEAQAPSFGGGPIGGVTTGEIVGAVAAAAAVVVVVVIVAIHYSKKRTITGCVTSGANGMTVTDEKDNQVYALSSSPDGVKPGDRMKLRGKRVKSKSPDKVLVWETKSVAKDYGVCQP